jgi:hypothetical protein
MRKRGPLGYRGLCGAADMTEGKLPPEMKRGILGLILMLLGYICVSAVFFYLIYLLYMSLHGRRR